VNEDFAREEICRVGRSLFDRGYVHSTAGNISVRLPHGFLITPTDACLGFLVAGDIALVSDDGEHRSGARPSKTLALHRRIYEQTSAGCVLHTHSTHCVALSLQPHAEGSELLPPITPYYVMRVGRVPLIAYGRPGAPEVADAVAAEIGRRQAAGVTMRAVMLERLGPTVWHDTPAQAMAVLEELEETARLWMMSTPRPTPLSDIALDELREVFGARW